MVREPSGQGGSPRALRCWGQQSPATRPTCCLHGTPQVASLPSVLCPLPSEPALSPLGEPQVTEDAGSYQVGVIDGKEVLIRSATEAMPRRAFIEHFLETKMDYSCQKSVVL